MPDTCGCTLDISWDNEDKNVPQTGEAIVKACEAHAHITNAQDLFTAIKTENTAKNIGMNTVTEAIKELTSEEPSYEINEDRDVIITVPDAAKDLVAELNAATPDSVIVQ